MSFISSLNVPNLRVVLQIERISDDFLGYIEGSLPPTNGNFEATSATSVLYGISRIQVAVLKRSGTRPSLFRGMPRRIKNHRLLHPCSVVCATLYCVAV